jgi:hypothetical protein
MFATIGQESLITNRHKIITAQRPLNRLLMVRIRLASLQAAARLICRLRHVVEIAVMAMIPINRMFSFIM